MGGSQKSVGQGKDGAITNPIRQKPYRRNGLQRKDQHKIPVPKSMENGAITNSRLGYAESKLFTRRCDHQPLIYNGPEKNESIHKAVRSPTHYKHTKNGR